MQVGFIDSPPADWTLFISVFSAAVTGVEPGDLKKKKQKQKQKQKQKKKQKKKKKKKKNRDALFLLYLLLISR